MRQERNKIFNFDNYTYLAISVMVLNSIGIIRVNPKSQYFSVALAGFLGITLLINFYNRQLSFKFKEYKLQYIILIASILSLLFNYSYISKNIYSTVSIFTNFFIFFSISKSEDYKEKMGKIAEILLIVLLIINFLNLFMLYFNLTIQITSRRYMGVDKLRGRFSGLSANANGLARLSLSGIIVSLLYLIYTQRASLMLASSSVFLHSYILLISQSRGTILALLIGITTFISLLFLKQKCWNRVIGISLMIITLLLGSVLTLKYYMDVSTFTVKNTPIYVFDKDNSEKDEVLVDRNERDEHILEDDVSNGRLLLMQNGINTTREENLLFGLSYGGNKPQIQNYIDMHKITVPKYIYNGAGSMHNTFVQFFVNVGLFGLLPFVALFSIYIYIWIRRVLFDRSLVVTNEVLTMAFIVSSLFVLNIVEWVFYFDFDNHLVNFFQMFVMGWTFYQFREKERRV